MTVSDHNANRPDQPPSVARTRAALGAQVNEWRGAGLKIGFVPTMGALHEGHLSLVDKARSCCDRVVASIFINPKQFAPHEDLEAYPRGEAADLRQLSARGCDMAYIPATSSIYPEGFQTSIHVGKLSQGLCGASRPHFFAGVATVVCKLLNQCRPDVAVFGEKDYQQLLVVRRMAQDLDLGVEIIGAPIMREPDGLAMSSRNAYLSAEERRTAGAINGAISAAAQKIGTGADIADTLVEGRRALLAAGVREVDYLEARDAETLAPLTETRPVAARVFVAAFVGETRLIDNWPIRPAG